jgi:hypothetical protein
VAIFRSQKGPVSKKSLGSTALYSPSLPCCSYQNDQGGQAGQLPKPVSCFGNDSKVHSRLFNYIRLSSSCNLKIHVLGKVHPTYLTYRGKVLHLSSGKTDKTFIAAGSTSTPYISIRLHGVASHKTVLVRRHQDNLKSLFIYYNAATKRITSKLYTT